MILIASRSSVIVALFICFFIINFYLDAPIPKPFLVLSVGFLVNLFSMVPVLSAEQATLSFGSVVVPEASVLQCILEAKKNSPSEDRSPLFEGSPSSDLETFDLRAKSCYQ